MAIGLGDNLGITGPLPTDNRYYNTSNNKPWASCGEVNLGITGARYTGLTVNILGVEYWYKNDIGDGDLVLKESAGGGLLNWSGSTSNAIGTYISVSGICAQPNLKFENNTLSVAGGASVTGLTITDPMGAISSDYPLYIDPSGNVASGATLNTIYHTLGKLSPTTFPFVDGTYTVSATTVIGPTSTDYTVRVIPDTSYTVYYGWNGSTYLKRTQSSNLTFLFTTQNTADRFGTYNMYLPQAGVGSGNETIYAGQGFVVDDDKFLLATLKFRNSGNAAGEIIEIINYSALELGPSGGTSGGGITIDGTTVNGLTTYVDSTTICSQPNIKFDGNALSLNNNATKSICMLPTTSFVTYPLSIKGGDLSYYCDDTDPMCGGGINIIGGDGYNEDDSAVGCAYGGIVNIVGGVGCAIYGCNIYGGAVNICGGDGLFDTSVDNVLEGGSVNLYGGYSDDVCGSIVLHDGTSEKLRTTSGGICVTGGQNITGAITSTYCVASGRAIKISAGNYYSSCDCAGVSVRMMGMSGSEDTMILGPVEATTASMCIYVGGGFKHKFCPDGTVDLGGTTTATILCGSSCVQAPFIYSTGMVCAAGVVCAVTSACAPTVCGTIIARAPTLCSTTQTIATASAGAPAICAHNTFGTTTGLAGVRGSTASAGIGYLGIFDGTIRAGVMGCCGSCTTSYGGYFYGRVYGNTCFQTTGTGYRFCGGTGCGTAVDWVATSDCRIKKCIEPITSALSTVDCLCGVCYELCNDDTKDMGLIAQDVEKVEPRLVARGDAPEEYKKYGIEDEMLSLKYDKFAGLFVEAIKELKTQNENLQNQINELRKVK